MNRREFIGVLSAATAGAAGCIDTSSSPDVSDTPLSQYNCPPDGINTSGFACPESPPEVDGPLVLTSSVQETSDASNVDLLLQNVSEETVRFNPGSWETWIEQSNEWSKIQKTSFADGVTELPPGQTYSTDVVTVIDTIREQEYHFEPGTYFLVKEFGDRSPATLFRIIEG